MDRRFSLALAVSLVFMLVYMNFFGPQPSEAPPEDEDPIESSAEGGGAQGSGDPFEGAGESPDPVDPEPRPSNATDVELNDEIWIETDVYRVRLSNRGATIADMFSKEYDARVYSEEELAGLSIDERQHAYTRDMDADGQELGRALLLRPVSDPEGALPVATSAWDWEKEEVDGGWDVRFHFEDGSGFVYDKVLRFRDGRHHVDVQIDIENPKFESIGGSKEFLIVAAGNAPDAGPVSFTRGPSGVVSLGEDYELEIYEGEDLYDDGSESIAVNDRLQFFGSFNNHFATVLRPDEVTAQRAGNVTLESMFDRPSYERDLARIEEDGPLSPGGRSDLKESEEYHNNARATLAFVVPLRGKQTLNFKLFAGPKLPSLMEDEEYAAFRQLYVEDYRSFAWINRSLLAILRGFQALVGNWGVAIILLTILVKALLFPVMRLQSRSMEGFQKKMAKLKPKLEELKVKYKSNVRKYQEEQQKLMRENQVRPPMAGCLIMFAQFPVFIGLFQILRSSFELRHQPFFLWIKDLSQPDALPLPFDLWLPFLGSFDTLNLLPVLMVVAMVFQFKMMPKPQDEQAAQMQKIMMIMPFGFFIFLYGYASGLSLYMLTNALLGIVQSKFFRVNTG